MATAITTISKRGQMVIPKEIREEMKLENDSAVGMKTINGKLVLAKIQLEDKDFELKEDVVKKLKKRETQKGIKVDSFAKRYGLE